MILAKTVKGFGMGKAGEGQMVTHQQKKLDDEALRDFRDRFNIPLTDEQIVDSCRFCKPADDAPEMKYLHERRQALGGYLPARASHAPAARDAGARRRSAPCSKARGEREISTTMALRAHPHAAAARTRTSASTSCPSCPTRRAPSAWKACSARSASIASVGQLYTPQDADQLMSYREDKKGQMLEEGINEAGSHLLVDRRRHGLCQPRRCT